MSHANWLEGRAWVAVVALLGLCGLLVGGCASTAIQAQWADPLFAGRSLRGATALVVCNANAPAIQHICQDRIAGWMLMSGIRPVMATEADLITAQGEQIADKIFAAARREGANAIWVATIAPNFTVVRPGLTVGFGIGGFGTSGGWHRSSGVGGGVGVGFPVGGEQVNTAYAADMTLTDVETGRLMWSSRITTPASQDITEQVTQLVEVGVKSAQQAADLAVQAGSRLSTDSASSYRAVKGYVHAFVNHTQKEYARGDVHENRAECLFSLLKPYTKSDK